MNTETNGVKAFRGHSQAMAFTRQGGRELNNLLFSIAKRKEEEGKGPIEMLVYLSTHFDIADLPVVGSKKGETGNKPYDKYTTEVTTEQGKRNVPGSWYTDAVKSTETWAELHQRRESIKQGQGDGVPADIIAMKPGDRALEKKRIERFIANMRTGLTRGSMLWHQVEAIASMNPARVKVRMPTMKQKDQDGNEITVVTGSLIRVYDPADVSDNAEPEVLTVSQFLAWDATKASADPDGGTIASLKATAMRGTKGKAGKDKAGTGSNYVAPDNLEKVLTLFNVLATGIDSETDEGEKLYAKLLTRVNAGGNEADETIMSIGKVCFALDSLWTIIRPKYTLLQEKKAKTANALASTGS